MKKVFAFFWGALLLSAVSWAGEKECIFGDGLDDLAKNSNFSIKEDVFRTFKLSRIPGDDNALLFVAIDIVKDKKSGRVFHLNRTFMDHYDGGNTLGWLEEVTDASRENEDGEGNVVALIGDSAFYSCKVLR